MSAAVATPERAGRATEAGGLEPRAGRLFDAGPTLDERVVAIWDELVASGSAECPVCGGALHVAGGCEDCGAELS